MVRRVRSELPHRGRAVLAGFVLLLLSAQTTALAGARGLSARCAPEGWAKTISVPPAGPALPGRVGNESGLQKIGCDPLPLADLPARPELSLLRASRGLGLGPTSRPPDAVLRPAPARGPPA